MRYRYILVLFILSTILIIGVYVEISRKNEKIVVRDGFYGINGILKDKNYLRDLRVDVHGYGFLIGINNFMEKGYKLHDKNILYTVRNGSTPVLIFLTPKKYDEDKLYLNVKKIVEYYTTGEGYRKIGVKIKYWIIGNEENGFWGTSCSAEKYASIVKIIGKAIKDVCPECKVIMGGLLYIRDNSSRSLEKYLRAFLENGGGKYIDIYNYHYYGLAKPVGSSSYYLTGLEIYLKMKRILNEYGYGDRDIWVQETSTFSGKVGDIFQSEEMQAADLVKRYVLLRYIGVKKVFWCYIVEPSYEGTGNGFFDQSGLVYDGKGDYDKGMGVKKKAYYAYKAMRNLLGNDMILIKAWNDSGTYMYTFSNKTVKITVIWHDFWLGLVNLSVKGEITVKNIYGDTIFSGRNFSYTLKIEPIYIIGEIEKINVTYVTLKPKE